jgi:2-polyprenyl-6-methoxyphenol hydroxylase-like FAD-dependent oxidoreductase
VRHGLGFTFDGTTQPSDWYLADGHISGLEPQDRLHIFWHKDGILAFFPIIEGRWRVIADLGPAKSDAHCPDPTLQEVQALITLRGTDGIVIKGRLLAGRLPHQRSEVAKYDRGRAFLAGDAAISTTRPAAGA